MPIPLRTRLAVFAAATGWLLSVAVYAGPDSGPEARGFRFEYDIAPILARHGCAAADCHGGATGRANFKLSLFATDARADYRAITQDLDGRRVNFVDPSESLLLKKPTRQLKHGGGKVLTTDDETYRTLRRWIRDEMPYHRGRPHQLESLSVTGASEGQVRVLADFSYEDGSREPRDVTQLARFSSTNSRTAHVSEEGLVTQKEPGITWITASYAGLSERQRVILPFSPSLAGTERAAPLSPHPLDIAWIAALDELGLTPAGPASPRTLVRRLYLDLAGRIPSPAEVTAFLDLPMDGRVATTAGELLQSHEFVEAMGPHLWSWFQVSAPGEEPGRRQSVDQRLRDQLDDWLTNQGRFENLTNLILRPEGGPFLKRFEDPRDRAEYFSKTLLGLSISCARCHNHPLDRWRQDEHLRFSAWFADPRPAPGQPETLMAGKFFLPGEQEAVEPALLPLGNPGNAPATDAGATHEVLSGFLLQSGNEAFTRNIANRVFGWLVGRYLVDPADDHRLTNPALHEPVLAALVESQSGTLLDLVRFIVGSQLYQVTTDPGEETSLTSDPAQLYLARRVAVPLTEHQRRRSIQQALGIPVIFRSGEAGSPLARQLAHLNDGQLQAALAEPGNAVDSLLLFEPDGEDRLEALFELILSRSPTPEERQAFTAAASDAAGCRELAFALFSSREFGSKR